jgi:hypothetical protein
VATDALQWTVRDNDDESEVVRGRRWSTRGLVGSAVVAVGLVLLAVTWLQIKDLQNVAAQIPYVVSGGLTGASLTVVGAIVLCTGGRPAGDPELRAELRDLTASSEWVADAVQRIAAYLDEGTGQSNGAARPSERVRAGGRSAR